jgi:tetratricopeptide (TPR) repeat protein
MRRFWVIGTVLAIIATVAFAGWRWGQHDTPPPPPEVAIDDPDLAEAVAKARADVLARPTDAAAWGLLGQTLLANFRPDPARECLAVAARLDPRDLRWPYLEGISLLQRDPPAALACWQLAAECPGDDKRSLTARLRWAEALLEADQTAAAETIIKGVFAHDPKNPRAHLALGLLAASRNDTSAAVDHLRMCASHPSARKMATTRLAMLYTLQNHPAEAAEAASRAEVMPPDADWPDPIREELLPLTVGRDALFVQAEKQQQMGNVEQATLLYQQVIQRYPGEARAYAKLGMLLAEIGDYSAAEGVLREGLRVAPDLVQGHFFLAVALFHQAERAGLTTPGGQAQLREAVIAARRATELKPDHGFAHLYLGLAQKHLGQKAEALVALRTSARLSSESADPHLHLGLLLGEDGKLKEAVAELETAARLASPSDSRPKAALERVRKGGPWQGTMP